MQLVQLSDIHVGSFFKQQVFDTVVEEVQLKVKSIAEDVVNRLLIDEESLLDLALKAVIEALRMNPDRYAVIYNSKYDNNDNIFDNSTTPSAMPSSPIPQNYYYNKYREGILEIA